MAKTTANYGLIKPERSDNYNVDVMANNMDVIDGELQNHKTKIAAIESEVNGDLVCNSVTADLSPCFGITSEANVISAIKFSYEETLASVRNSTVTKTVTYRTNPICNTVTFTVFSYKGRSYVKVNNNIVCDTGTTSGANTTKTATVTLNDGDTIYAYAYENGGSSVNTVKVSCIGFLTHGT